MKTVNKILIVIFLFFSASWFCCAQSNVQTQTINGLTTTTFLNNSGTVQVFLPNIEGSQTISGTIKTLPKGGSKRKKQKNLKALQALKLSIGNAPINIQNKQFTITSCLETVTISLEKNSDNLSTTTINLNEVLNTCPTTCIPNYMVAGSPAYLSTILLDGNINNTSVILNNSHTNILAESENHVFFEVPNTLSGQENLIFTEADTTFKETVNVLQLNLSAEKLNLLRSESTTLTVTVSGLEGLTNDVPLNITNNSTENIQLQDGNTQNISVPTQNDSFTINQTVTAINNGNYSVTATIILQELGNNETNEPPLCNCIIDDYSYLIHPNACNELGGQCYKPEYQIEFLGTKRDGLGDAVGNYNFTFNNLLSYAGNIEDLEDDINDLWDKWDRTKHLKDSLSKLHNDLVAIDKVLDRVPQAYKDKLKKAIDNLANAEEQSPEYHSDATLNKGIADAEARLKACHERLEELQKQQKELEEQLLKDKKELIKDLEYLKKYLDDFNIEFEFSFDEDGKLTYSEDWSNMFEYDRERLKNEGDLPRGLKNELYKKAKQYNKSIKRLKAFPQDIESAQEDCVQLSEALQRSKEAKAKADYKAAAELEVEEQCEQIKRLVKRLKNWCINNPEHCDFSEAIESLLKDCPKTTDELADFWKDFDAMLKKKKALEDSLAKKAKDAQNDLDKIEDEVSDLEDEIASLEEQRRKKHQEEQERKRQASAAESEEAAKAKALGDERKKQRNKQKKEDDKIKDLIKKAKSSEAGDDAFKDLLKGLGLGLLDEVSGNSKLGSIIGKLLTAKDVPDCTCPIIKALRDAIAARNSGEGVAVYVEAYLIEWKKCANLPSISSVSVGGSELTKSINNMTDSQAKKAIKALNQAVRVQCD